MGSGCEEPRYGISYRTVHLVSFFRQSESSKGNFYLCELTLVCAERYSFVNTALQKLTSIVFVGGYITVIYDNIINNTSITREFLKGLIPLAIVML